MALSEAAVGALISGAATVAGAGVQGYASGRMNKRAEKFNREEADKQRAWSESMAAQQNVWNNEMWQKMTDYDNPANAVQRLRDAGLNPLFYGLDGNTAAQAQPAAQPLGYERANAPIYANPFAGASDIAAKVAQISNIQAGTEKIKSETRSIEAKLPFEVDELKSNIRNSNADSSYKETVLKYLDRQQQAELRVKESTVAEADAMVRKLGAEIQKMDFEKVSMFISWIETNEKILNLQKQRELTDKQIEELSSLIRVNDANARKIGLDVDNYDDVTVIGTASHNIKLGPFSVQEGQPITLAMKKAAEEYRDEMSKDKNKSRHKRSGDQISATDNSPYNGPIYD